MRNGFVRFIPLLIIAVLLIGFVGYVSINKFKAISTHNAVLSDSDSGKSSGGDSRGGGSNDSGGSNSGSSSKSGESGSTNSTTTTVKRSETGTGTETELENETNDLNKIENQDQTDLELPEIETPDNLAQEALKLGTIDKIEKAESLESTRAGTPKIVRVRGTKNLKFLGLVPVTTPVSIDLDATTGKELNVEESSLIKLLDFLFTK